MMGVLWGMVEGAAGWVRDGRFRVMSRDWCGILILLECF